MPGIIDIAVNGARLIKKLSDELMETSDINIRYEYSPESFTGTEMDNAVEICQRVLEELGATPENKVILNLPSTVEGSTPNGYADQIEYFCRHLKDCLLYTSRPPPTAAYMRSERSSRVLCSEAAAEPTQA